MTHYFISDLHLCPEHDAGTRLFQHFMAETAPQAKALYVLGDLFEAWVGDDDDEPYVERILALFRAFAASGKPLLFLRGNRDFLIGSGFAARSGGKLLDEQTVIQLDGKPVLLTHGDELCTDDVEYQKFRAMVRNPAWQAALLAKPLAERKQIAAAMRQKSRESQQNKVEYIGDVNPEALMAAMRRHRVTRIIHGHTHRPAHHRFLLDGENADRYVLGDWHESARILRVAADWELETISL